MSLAPYDLAIVGGGPVGLALAGWLLRTSDWRIALIDARAPEDVHNDPRAMAVSQGSRMLLEQLGAWPASATAIHTIHVSQRGHFGQTVIHRDDYNQPALGYVVRYGELVAGLAQSLRDTARRVPRLTWLTRTTATGIDDVIGQPVQISLQPGHGDEQQALSLPARFAVHAEGGLFHTQSTHPGVHRGQTRDYQQTAILATVSCTEPLPHRAWERFTPEGPLALLPVTTSLSAPSSAAFSLVWCGEPHNVAQRMALDDRAFLDALGAAFGDRMGRFTAVGKRSAYPLGLTTAAELVRGRLVAIGNAAQTLHPVAGQGLNLGLRDAFTLASTVRDDLSEAALQRFAHARRIDRAVTIGLTDFLPRVFSGTFTPLALARGAALAALECIPPLKHMLARQMMVGQRG